MRWLRIIAFAILACLVLIAAVGFIYEQIGRARDRRLSSARVGQPYSVHGHSMNLYCSGSGSPTVVFETGGNAPGYSWLTVQPKVAQFTRACWYDRAGVGWSDSPATVRTSASIADDLHELLRTAGEHAPFLFVGASVGGEYSRIYAARFPAEVAGMVLVDSSHPDQQRACVPAGASESHVASHEALPVRCVPMDGESWNRAASLTAATGHRQSRLYSRAGHDPRDVGVSTDGISGPSGPNLCRDESRRDSA